MIECMILSKTDQYIHGRVLVKKNNMSFYLVAIYGLHIIHNRAKLWAYLTGLVTNSQEPMICMGDFNVVLSGDDRPQGRPIQEVEIRDFNYFMLDNGMNELKSVGRTCTWSNGHSYSKIDRAVVNVEWMLKMSQLEVNVMNPGTSDHSPLCLELDRTITGTHRAFKFFNCIVEHPQFMKRVKEALLGGHKDLMGVRQKLKKVKASIKQLNTKEFQGVSNKVKDIRMQLQNVQEPIKDRTKVADNR